MTSIMLFLSVCANPNIISGCSWQKFITTLFRMPNSTSCIRSYRKAQMGLIQMVIK